LTYANVVATLALFLAVGGGAYAVSKIGSKQIKRNAVKSRHLAPNAAKGSDVSESTLGTVPNAARLGGRSAGQIVARIDFGTTGATAATPVTKTQTIGGIELTYVCTVNAGNGELRIEGDRKVDASVIFDTTVSRSNDTLGHMSGGFEPEGTLFSEQDPPGRGNLWSVWREPNRTVAIQARYDVFDELNQADCDLRGVATIAEG
jgi:hypothetical protein